MIQVKSGLQGRCWRAAAMASSASASGTGLATADRHDLLGSPTLGGPEWCGCQARLFRRHFYQTSRLSGVIIENITLSFHPQGLSIATKFPCAAPIVLGPACYYPRRLNRHFSINNGTKERGPIGHFTGEGPETPKQAPEMHSKAEAASQHHILGWLIKPSSDARNP
jgi:hypothetical protein